MSVAVFPRTHAGAGPRWIVIKIRTGPHKGRRKEIPVFPRRRWLRSKGAL